MACPAGPPNLCMLSQLTLMVLSADPEMICGSTELVTTVLTVLVWPDSTWMGALVRMSHTCNTHHHDEQQASHQT